MKNLFTCFFVGIIAFLGTTVATLAQTPNKKLPSLATPINTDTGQKNDKTPKTEGQNNTQPNNQGQGNKNTGNSSGTKQAGQTNNKGNTTGSNSNNGKTTPESNKTKEEPAKPKEEPVKPQEKPEAPKEEAKPTKEMSDAERKQANITSTKKQLIADGYELCVEHPKYGPVYCKETENKYFYIDSDGIATPVKKALVVAEKEPEPQNGTHQDKKAKPNTGFNPRPAERIVTPGEMNGWKTVNSNLIASWPLNNSANDVTGKQQAVATNKATFQSNALWCPGNSGGADPYGNAMLAPALQGLNMSNFMISFEFYTTNIQRQPIIVIGTGCRWFGAEMDADGSLAMLVNNADRTSTGVKFPTGQWNTVQLKYANGTAQMLLNGQVISAKNVQFDIAPCGSGDTRIGTSNHSNASAYTGYIRNLQVNSY